MTQIKEPTLVTDPEERKAILARVQEERTQNSRDRIAEREAILPSPLPTFSRGGTGPSSAADAITDTVPGAEVITDPDLRDKYIGWANEEAGAGSGFFWGLRTGAGLVENVYDIITLNERQPASFGDFVYDAATQMTLAPDVRAGRAEEGDMTKEEALALGHKERMTGDLVNRAISARPDLQEKMRLSILGGNLAAAVGDPTSILPLAPFANLGKGYTAYVSAAMMGGAIGGADMAAFQTARTGETNAKDIMAGAALGAALGPLMVFGIRKVRGLQEHMRQKQILDEPLTPDEVRAHLEHIREAVPGSREIVPYDPSVTVRGPHGRIIDGEFTVDDIETVAEAARKAQEGNVAQGDWVGVTRALNEALGLPKGLEKPSPVDAKSWPEIVAGGEYRGELNHRLRSEGREPLALPKPKNSKPIPKSHWREVVRLNELGTDLRWNELLEGDLKEIRKLVSDLNAKQAAKEAAEPPPIPDNVVPLMPKPRPGRPAGREGGFANTQLLSTVAGGSIGYALDGPDGAVMGALIGGGLPYGLGMLRKIGKKPATAADEDSIKFQMLRFSGFGTPIDIIRNHLGPAGKRLADGMERAQLRAERATGDAKWRMDSIARAGRAAGFKADRIKAIEKEAMRVLQKSVDPSKVSGAARKMAIRWRKELNNQLDEAVNAGIMSKDKANSLKLRAATKGYFPRVYNEAFLTTKEGQEKWMEVFTRQGFPPKEAEAMIRSIVGDEQEATKLIRELVTKDGTKNVFISRDIAQRMYDLRRKHRETARSGHLEMRRGIHVPTEQILEPFLLPDARAAMLQYLDETNRRIAYAREFGANDEGALSALGEINKRFGNDATQKAGEIYWQRVGDSRSTQISYAANMSDMKRNILGRVNAFETLKLLKAQILNSGQAIVNGSILAARISGGNPFKSLQLLASIGKDLKRNPGKFRETADRSAAALETSLMQILGEWSGTNHRIIGREFTGNLKALEYINNPTKFLEGTGFVGIEKLQRMVAANMGRSYGEEVTEGLQALRAQGDTSSKAYRKLQRQARELGLDPNAPVYTESDMLDVALRWSDQVNFRNTPGNMALAWTHPNAVWFRKFKQFAFSHARFLMNNVIKPAADKERSMLERGLTVAGTAGALAGAATIIGVPIDKLRRLVSGDDKDYTMTELWLRGFTAIGGLGIWWDTLTSFSPLAAFAGPAFSDIEKGIKEGQQLAKGDQGPAKTLADLATGTLVLPREQQIKEMIDDNFE